jgi:hypothetical protein
MLAVCIGSAACMVHLHGMVLQEGGAPVLVESDGSRWKLVLGPESRVIAALDGHDLDVTGRRLAGRRVAVGDEWRVGDGRHGLPTWVGVLQLVGVQLGVQDRNSGAFYLVDRDAEETLRPFVGRTVLVEGYVEGAHVVKVVYYRVLD